MRKFVATAAIAASAAAILLPAAAQAAVEPTRFGNLTICSNTLPGGGGIPNGDPVFVRLAPQSQGPSTAAGMGGAAVTVGVQDNQCQTVNIGTGLNLQRVKVDRLTSAASQKMCGPAAGDFNCYGTQPQLGELSWSDVISSGRTRANNIEVTVDAPGQTGTGQFTPPASTSFVTFWTASAW